MPLKLSVGLTKKIGQPDYGSLGASCYVELELDSTLLRDDLEVFHRHVHDVYVACAQAVNDELYRHRHDDPPTARKERTAAVESRDARNHSMRGNNGRANNGRGNNVRGNNVRGYNGQGGEPHGELNDNNSKPSSAATDKQQAYIRQLAQQTPGLGGQRIDALAQRLFAKPVNSLSSFEASSLIDQLKAIKNGQIDVDKVLGNGAAV